MKLCNPPLKARHKKLTNTISSGERGQWEEEKTQQVKNIVMLTFPFITHNWELHTEKPKQERCEMKERERKKAQKGKRAMIV